MLTLEDTALMPPSPATRRAGLRHFETYVQPRAHEVDTKDLLRAALDTTDHGERKLICSVLRRQYRLTRWWNAKTGQMIGERKE